jgi:hypothetical protein
MDYQLTQLIENIALSYKPKVDRKEHLWMLAEQNICPMIYSKCTVHIDLKINGMSVRCFLDTGAQTNVISENAIRKFDLETFIDRTAKGTVLGVGTSNINGIIPYVELQFNDFINLPVNFYVMEKMLEHDILLGLPFMTFYQVKLYFELRQASIAGNKFDLIIKEH